MNFASTWNNLLKYCISVEYLLMGSCLQGALQKKIHIDPFVERFETVTLGRSHWWIFLVLGAIYLNIAFPPSAFSLIEVNLQAALRKDLRIAPFVQRFQTATLGRPCWWILPVLGTKNRISVDFLLVGGYIQGALRKKLFIAALIKHFKTDTLGRSYWYVLPALGTI